jgi:hypothetical protein
MGYYDDPAGLIAACVVLEVLAGACVGLRCYTRKWKGQVVLASDWVMLVAFAFGTGLTVMEIYGQFVSITSAHRPGDSTWLTKSS